MKRRFGDTVSIPGRYQYDAMHSHNSVQKFWHYSKIQMIDFLLPPESTDKILDVGCGSGVISEFLGKSGASIQGIDGNQDAIEFATKQFSSQNINFKHGYVDHNFTLNTSMDKVYCLEVIEHIHDHQAKIMLKSIFNILKEGGYLYLTTPNYRSLWPVIEFSMDLLKLAPPLKDHQHVEHYTIPKLKTICLEAGFEIVDIRTSCFLAPWTAFINWRLAEKISLLEMKSPIPLGSILNIIVRKPEKIT